MKTILALTFALVVATAPAQTPTHKPTPLVTLQSILLEQLHLMHDREEWFAPAKVAIAGLTPSRPAGFPPPGSTPLECSSIT